MTGRRICAQCEQDGRPSDMGPAQTERDSHGLCPACLERALAAVESKHDRLRRAFLASEGKEEITGDSDYPAEEANRQEQARRMK